MSSIPTESALAALRLAADQPSPVRISVKFAPDRRKSEKTIPIHSSRIRALLRIGASDDSDDQLYSSPPSLPLKIDDDSDPGTQAPARSKLRLGLESSDEEDLKGDFGSLPVKTLVLGFNSEDEMPMGDIIKLKASGSPMTPDLSKSKKSRLSIVTRDDAEHSFEITATSIHLGGYEIKEDGIVSVPLNAKERHPSSDSLCSSTASGIDFESSFSSIGTPLSGTLKLNGSRFVMIGSGLGRGNSGSVAKAISLEDHRVYALKSVGVYDKENRAQLIKELDAYYALQSPYLVTFHGAFYDQGSIYFVLEYMNRGSLQSILDDIGEVDEFVLKIVAKQVLLGLADMHAKGQIHRDIKPANILLSSAGRAKISDFGIAKGLGPAEEAQSFVGTQIYMSPERIMSKPYSYVSDIWSFGLTLHALAAGKFPYEPSKSGSFIHLFQTITKEAAPKLPRLKYSKELRSFLSHCLEKDPEARWSAEKLLTHPFVSEVNLDDFKRWPWDDIPSERDRNEIIEIAGVLAKKTFKKNPYRRSKENMQIFERIAESLHVPVSEVQILIERNLPISCLAESPFN